MEQKKQLNYNVIKSKKAKRVRITVKPGGEVVVTVPWFLPKIMGEKFLAQNQDWVLMRVEKLSQVRPIGNLKHTRYQIAKYKLQARELVKEKLALFNREYGFKYRRIAIRNQKTRWGSCSADKNLNFNYKIVLLPQKLADYLVVHELCHLKEMNHSARFWTLVSKTIPDHKRRRKELNKYDLG